MTEELKKDSCFERPVHEDMNEIGLKKTMEDP
jgi:hypothetical protein